MSHWQVFETPLPGYAQARFLRCAVWANAPRDALATLANHDRAWQHSECRHIAIWEDNYRGAPVDGLVHWVVDAQGQPISGNSPPAAATAIAAVQEAALPVLPVSPLLPVPEPVQAGAYNLPSPTQAPVAYPVADPHSGGHTHAHVARETLHSTDTNPAVIAQLAAELDALKAYIRGQTLADLAFQEHALLENARRLGDVNLIKSAEASAASSFGPEWRTRIPALLDKGRALDAAALQSS